MLGCLDIMNPIVRRSLKLTVRLLILAGALFLVLGGPLVPALHKLLPILSPLNAISEAVAQRSWFAALFWLLPPLAVLVLAVFKGRFFCQWLCPLGTVYSLPQKISLKKRVLRVRLNALFFWMIIASSLFGLSSLLWLDPLSTFSRLGAWQNAAMWLPGFIVPLFLLISFFQPQAWCTHLCPLGYCFDLANRKTAKRTFMRDRRQFIAGLGLGGAAGLLHRRAQNVPMPGKPQRGGTEEGTSVLPPGATEQFADTCTRCYACINSCPEGIIKVKKDGSLKELAMPELIFDESYCLESCNSCSQACPAGAIRPLTLEQKDQLQIGIARVRKGKCMSWAEGEICMLCADVCPYYAIDSLEIDGVDCPVVDNDLCLGCGACETICPVYRNGKAIHVLPVSPQQEL